MAKKIEQEMKNKKLIAEMKKLAVEKIMLHSGIL